MTSIQIVTQTSGVLREEVQDADILRGVVDIAMRHGLSASIYLTDGSEVSGRIVDVGDDVIRVGGGGDDSLSPFEISIASLKWVQFWGAP